MSIVWQASMGVQSRSKPHFAERAYPVTGIAPPSVSTTVPSAFTVIVTSSSVKEEAWKKAARRLHCPAVDAADPQYSDAVLELAALNRSSSVHVSTWRSNREVMLSHCYNAWAKRSSSTRRLQSSCKL